MDIIIGIIVIVAAAGIGYAVWRHKKPEVAARYDSRAELEAAADKLIAERFGRFSAPAAPPQQPPAPPSGVAPPVSPPVAPAGAGGGLPAPVIQFTPSVTTAPPPMIVSPQPALVAPDPLPVGAIPLEGGGFVFQGVPFATLAEFYAWQAKVQARDANLAAWDINEYPKWDAAKVNAVLANFDASMAAGREDLAFYQLSQEESFALRNRGHTQAWINAKISQYNSGPGPAP